MSWKGVVILILRLLVKDTVPKDVKQRTAEDSKLTSCSSKRRSSDSQSRRTSGEWCNHRRKTARCGGERKATERCAHHSPRHRQSYLLPCGRLLLRRGRPRDWWKTSWRWDPGWSNWLRPSRRSLVSHYRQPRSPPHIPRPTSFSYWPAIQSRSSFLIGQNQSLQSMHVTREATRTSSHLSKG